MLAICLCEKSIVEQRLSEISAAKRAREKIGRGVGFTTSALPPGNKNVIGGDYTSCVVNCGPGRGTSSLGSTHPQPNHELSSFAGG